MDTRFSDDILQARELFDRLMKRINTAIPGRIDLFDPATQTCTVTPAVKSRIYSPDGTTSDVDLPSLVNVPLVFPFAVTAGFALTLPVQPGDSCLLIFSQRCIDNWWQNGGVQPAETGAIGARHHDLNDGFAILCGGPLPSVLGAWCGDGIEIRNRARTVRLTLRDSGVEVAGPVIFKSDVTFQGAMTDKNGIDHSTHKHTGVQTGGGTSGVPHI